jgi:hypothetical protein
MFPFSLSRHNSSVIFNPPPPPSFHLSSSYKSLYSLLSRYVFSPTLKDTCLVLSFRHHPANHPTSTSTSTSRLLHSPRPSDSTFTPPPLGKASKAGYQKIVFRARSKLDRDSWAWAINWEIERLVRRRREREERLRGFGAVG